MNNHREWFYVRLIYLAITSCVAPMALGSGKVEFDKYGFSGKVALILFGFSVLGVIFVIFMQSVTPYSDDQWMKPSWFSNPVNFRQPIQAMHLSAWTFIGMGLSIGIYTLISWSFSLAFAFFLIIGVGCYIGVWTSVFLFKDKFASDK